MIRPRIVGAGLLAVAISQCAFAQSYSSFFQWDSVTGVAITGSGQDYSVMLPTSGAQFTSGANTYDILNIFGFYVLGSSSSVDMSGFTGSNFPTAHGNKTWQWNGNTGGIAGWEENASHNADSILPGDTLAFHFNSVGDVSPLFYGLHWSYELHGTNDVVTSYWYGNQDGHRRVFTPEPVTSSLGIAGAFAFIRRRKRAKQA